MSSTSSAFTKYFCSTNHAPSIRTNYYQFLALLFLTALFYFSAQQFTRQLNNDRPRYAKPTTYITSECNNARRLGNVMFTYASLVGIARRNNVTPIIPSNIKFTKIFELQIALSPNIDNTMLYHKVREEFGRRGGSL